METRNITIVSTKDQKRSVISTDATTLGELKAALHTAGINYEGMTFYEGLTHSEYNVDSAILPHDVEYKGSTTNELVFMLTNSNKKIRSGALSEARAALYATIEEKGLADACVARYGKNMTNCSNAELLELVEDEAAEAPVQAGDDKVVAAIDKLLDVLVEEECIYDCQAAVIRRILNDGVQHGNSPYTDDEIDEMFADVEA